MLSSGSKISKEENGFKERKSGKGEVHSSIPATLLHLESLYEIFSMAPSFLMSTTSLTTETTKIRLGENFGKNPGEKEKLTCAISKVATSTPTLRDFSSPAP